MTVISVSTAIGVAIIPVNGAGEFPVEARSPSRLALVPPEPAATPRADGVPFGVFAPPLEFLVLAGIVG